MPPPSQTLLTASQLGQLLQSARKARKMSQAALASRVGLSQSRVSHLELHAEELSVAQLMAWCAALNLELALGPRGGDKAPSSAQGMW
ncbi:MAG: helix-turn-helix domain-containing protein [Candidatus Accumulibacter sp.]|jgi:HTH-type transcriptional regulator/antitoxin HipB|nr:helix-turn-helix domain-containing protein [Accumulibacter sp.]